MTVFCVRKSLVLVRVYFINHSRELYCLMVPRKTRICIYEKNIMFKYLEFHQNQIPTSCIQYSLCWIRIVYQYLTYHVSNTLHGTTRQKPSHQSSMDPRKFLATIFYRLVYEFHHVLLRKGLSSGKHRHL